MKMNLKSVKPEKKTGRNNLHGKNSKQIPREQDEYAGRIYSPTVHPIAGQ